MQLRHNRAGQWLWPLSIVLLFAEPRAAIAADPTTELPAGGLVFAAHPDLVTDKVDIIIAVDRIRATYVVRNAGVEARTTPFAFALPDIDMLALDGSAVDNPAYDPRNPLNYVGFAANADNQAVDTYVEARALALGLIDGTAKLREYNLPIYPLAPDIGQSLAALPNAARNELSGRGLIRPNEGQWEPLWRLKSTLFWQQSFAVGQTRTIVLSYRPIVGSAAWTPELAATLQQRYCVPAPVAAELSARGVSGAPAPVKWVTFQASAGAVGIGPAGSYRLAIETAGSAKTAYTCHDALTVTTATGSREKLLAAYTPDDDVQVLFVE